MAATKRNAMLIAEARDKIKTTQLINRLQNHAFGELEMSESQIKATSILLRKSIPDLQSVEHANDPDNPLFPPEADPRKLALVLHEIVARAGKGEEPK